MLKEHFQKYFVRWTAEVANANGLGREYVVMGYVQDNRE